MSYYLPPNTKHDGQYTFIQNTHPFDPTLSIYQSNHNMSPPIQENNRSNWVYPDASMPAIDKGQQNSIIQQQHLLHTPIVFPHMNTPLSPSTINDTPVIPTEVMNWDFYPDTGYLKNTRQTTQQYNVATTEQLITSSIYASFPPTQQVPFYEITQQPAATMPIMCNITDEDVNPIGSLPSSIVSSYISTKIQEIGYISDGDRKSPTTFANLSKSQLMDHQKQLEDKKGHSSSLNWVSDDPSKSNGPRDDDKEKESDIHMCRWANCCIVTRSLDELITHIRETHIGGGKTAYHCEWMNCPRNKKPFMKRHKMHNHLRTHTGERPFVCTMAGCDKRFSRPDSLNTHIRTHSNIRPYSCPVDGCDKAYFHSRSLRKHVKGHEAAGIVVPRPVSRAPAKNKHHHTSASPSLSSPTSITSTLSPTSITIPLASPSHPHFVASAPWDPSSFSPPLVSTHFYAPTFPGSPVMPMTKMPDMPSYIYPGYSYHPFSLL